ncbi:hypothetical protein LguiB_000976 [Lonicera macranthoides]
MDRRKSFLLVAILLVLVSMEATVVRGAGNGNKNGNSNNSNSGNNNGNNNSNGNTYKNEDEDYDDLEPENGIEKARCKSNNAACHMKNITCPAECPQKRPTKNKKQKACYINCGVKCEATCKWRKSNCDGNGALCYDPRFVGGDGVMFYFHGSKGGDFAVVSDNNLQINAHFIGSRPQGRTRDYTWVQALSIMFDTHTLVLAASKVSHWDDSVDTLMVRWDGELVTIPTDGLAEWRASDAERKVRVERTDDTNAVRVKVAGLVEMDVKVTPISEKENKVQNYQLPSNDAFAHLETQFRFTNLSDKVEGILGKTYRPGYISPAKRGVPMPMMGGEDKYQTPSLYSPLCKVCMFQAKSGTAMIM